MCAERVAFATLAKSWSGVDESENVGDEMDLIFCCSLYFLVSALFPNLALQSSSS